MMAAVDTAWVRVARKGVRDREAKVQAKAAGMVAAMQVDVTAAVRMAVRVV